MIVMTNRYDYGHGRSDYTDTDDDARLEDAVVQTGFLVEKLQNVSGS